MEIYKESPGVERVYGMQMYSYLKGRRNDIYIYVNVIKELIETELSCLWRFLLSIERTKWVGKHRPQAAAGTWVKN